VTKSSKYWGDLMKSEELTMEETNVILYLKKCIYLFVKRIFDIFCSVVGVLFLIPISIIIKICYVCTGDFNSIFYSQLRIGKKGKVFRLYKYRTMIVSADEVLENLLKNDPKLKKEYEINKKLKNDPRITKCGKLIRKLSIDELPQLFNVLFGQMSLVGNRPYLPKELPDMGKYYEDIIKTKPGITGLWQVSGRSNITFKKRLRIEQQYSKEFSFRLDMKILFHTFAAVFKGDGAM